MAVIVKRLGYTQISSVGGSNNSGYAQAISLGSWTADVGLYYIDILQTVHGKGVNPIVHAYQSVGPDFEEVIVGYTVSVNGNVRITVNANPDARFQGRVVIK